MDVQTDSWIGRCYLMKLEDKASRLSDYCDDNFDVCDGCPHSDDTKEDWWCHFPSSDPRYAAFVDKSYKYHFGEPTVEPTEAKTTNPYWERICKLQDKQRAKGIETYGQGLEDNHEPVMKRIQHIQEELIDGLMYLEWLKDALGGNIDG